MKDGQAIRQRLLDAAAAEFAAHGIADARVGRISANARTDNAQLYAYHGSKDGLFDAVLNEHRKDHPRRAPDGRRSSGYATRLYDACLVHPDMASES